ncbi:MAG: aldo/keto reductase [Desulfobacterales bacterium]|nr:aldo/keto reductase [Desulfobacterales bacterium]
MPNQPIDKNVFAGSQVTVTRVGLGGEGILRTHGEDDRARKVIRAALAEGIAYFDSARVYADSERYYGALWGMVPETRRKVFQTSKSARRDKKGAREDLEASLKRLQTDRLDLWQIHDVRTAEDLLRISDPGGALEAFTDAKAAGTVRFIGVTGHHDPAILTAAVRDWPVDAVMLPVNPVEGVLGGFLTETLPAARKKGLATIAMKVLGGAHFLHPESGAGADVLVRYALSLPVTVVIVGCASPEEVRCLAEAARDPTPLSASERQRLENLYAPYAKHLAFYRGSG